MNTDQSSAPASGSLALTVNRLTMRLGDRVAMVWTLGTLITPTSGSATIACVPLASTPISESRHSLEDVHLEPVRCVEPERWW